jgi:hypothetical protein
MYKNKKQKVICSDLFGKIKFLVVKSYSYCHTTFIFPLRLLFLKVLLTLKSNKKIFNTNIQIKKEKVVVFCFFL